MARSHQNSNWNNPNQGPQGNRRNGQCDERDQGPQQMPMGQPGMVNRYNIPQEINVVTRVVSDYDNQNYTVAKTIIQPIALVPYNTTEQPLYQYSPNSNYGNEMGGYDDDNYGYGNNGNYGSYGYDNAQRGARSASKGGVNALKVILIILSVIHIAVVVLGKFVNLAYFKFDLTRSGLEILLTVTTVFGGGLAIKDMLFPILLAVNCLFVVFVLLDGIILIKKGVNIFIKVIAVIALLSIAGFGYLIFANSGLAGIGYGLYITAGATALIAILALLGKRRR